MDSYIFLDFYQHPPVFKLPGNLQSMPSSQFGWNITIKMMLGSLMYQPCQLKTNKSIYSTLLTILLSAKFNNLPTFTKYNYIMAKSTK